MCSDFGAQENLTVPKECSNYHTLVSHASKVKWIENLSVMSDSLWPHGLNILRNSPGQNTEVGSLFLLQGIFPTQGSNPGPPHCRRILYQLSFKGSPRILEWVAFPFSRGSYQPRDQSQVSHIADGFFTSWATRKAQLKLSHLTPFFLLYLKISGKFQSVFFCF